MASGAHVSKRKPSSSSSHHKKKKLSKKSHEGKKGKRSRSRKSDSKSRKLLRRRGRDVSVSCSYSEDDSWSDDSLSVSLSSDSEDDYSRRRKGRSRSRTRGDGKRSKKRVKRSLSDRSESPVRKKRKGSKKSDGSKLKNHSRCDKERKRRSKRDLSVEPSSEDSRDLSVSSGSDDSKSLRTRVKVKAEVKRSLDRSGDEGRYKYRSRSCSACSEDGDQFLYDRSEERSVSGNQPGRLRSVLTFPDKIEEGGRYQSKDENEAEVIHALDDSPPCKSNDSYEVGRKRDERFVHDRMVEDEKRKEFSHVLNVPPEKKTQTSNGDEDNALTSKTKTVEMVKGERRKEFSHQMKIAPEKKAQIHDGNAEDVFTSKTRMLQSAKDIKGDGVVPYGGMQQTANTEATKIANKSEVSSGIVGSELSDLESNLRQKALENFRKFRTGNQPNTTVSDQKNRNGVNQPSTLKNEAVKTESSKEVDSSTVRANNTKASVIKHSSTAVVERIAVMKSPIHGAKVPDCNSKQLESHDTIRAIHPSVRRTPDGNSKQLDTCDTMRAVNPLHRNDKSVSDRLVDTTVPPKRIINLGGIRKLSQGSLVYRRQPSQGCSDGRAQETQSMPNRVVSQPPKAAVMSSSPSKSSTSEATLCLAPAATGEQVITESGNAAKGGLEVKYLETKNIPNKNVSSPPKANDPQESNRSPGSVASEDATSLPIPETRKHDSGNVDNGDSEFERKTMTVMRGGKPVQVNYKVYIPQMPRARRQLKR